MNLFKFKSKEGYDCVIDLDGALEVLKRKVETLSLGRRDVAIELRKLAELFDS